VIVIVFKSLSIIDAATLILLAEL